eukprot:2258865-Rhodomonas_salina.2
MKQTDFRCVFDEQIDTVHDSINQTLEGEFIATCRRGQHELFPPPPQASATPGQLCTGGKKFRKRSSLKRLESCISGGAMHHAIEDGRVLRPKVEIVCALITNMTQLNRFGCGGFSILHLLVDASGVSDLGQSLNHGGSRGVSKVDDALTKQRLLLLRTSPQWFPTMVLSRTSPQWLVAANSHNLNNKWISCRLPPCRFGRITSPA